MKKEKDTDRNENDKTNKVFSMLKKIFLAVKRHLLRNFGWKIISLISAFLVWMAIMNMEDPYVSVILRNLPVTVHNEGALQEQGKISDIESGRTVDIKVRAPRSVADNLTEKDFEVVADYRQMSLVYAVPIQVKVSRESRFAAEDITIESKSPEVMLLTLEDYAKETFRVDISVNGKAADGYYVSNMTARPNLVQIAGSKKQIDQIEKVVVDIDTTGSVESFEQVAAIRAYDKNGYLVDDTKLEFEAKDVEVEVTVLPVKTILLLVTIEGTPSYGYECTGTQHVPTEITIAGTMDDLQEIYAVTMPFDINMQNQDVEAQLNIETYLNEHYDGKYVLVGEDKYVTVKATIEKMPTMDFRVGSSDIEVRGLAEGYDIVFTNRSDINIKVLGSSDVLEQLTIKDLKLYIDVTDYEPGSYYVSVYSDAQNDVTVHNGTIGIEINKAKDVFEVVSPGKDSDEEPDSEHNGGESLDGENGGVDPGEANGAVDPEGQVQ